MIRIIATTMNSIIALVWVLLTLGFRRENSAQKAAFALGIITLVTAIVSIICFWVK